MRKRILDLSLVMALGLSLGACEFRQTDAAQEEEGTAWEEEGEALPPEPGASDPLAGPTEEPLAEPAPEETQPISIIREEVLEVEEPVIEPVAATIPFGDGGNDIGEEAERLLAEILESPALREGWTVTLRGHTDSSGNDSANLRASRARAEAVAAWLVERGVDDERIEVIAFGEQNPIAPNALPDGSPDEEGRARNRRVDIEIAP